MSGISILDIE
ncbi:hypothetical protein VCHENC02_1208, partial [Vibrio harveyi]